MSSGERSEAAGAPGVFVHPRGLVESADVGAGTRVWAFAHVMAGARVGRDCNLGQGVFVEAGAVVGDRATIKNGVQIWAGVTLEDDVFLGPHATFTNDLRPRAFVHHRVDELAKTHIGRGATIGANATVLGAVTVGAYAMVGAGSVVLRSVPAHALVVGNPARRIGWVCVCGRRLDEFDAAPWWRCGTCGKHFAPAGELSAAGLLEVPAGSAG